MEDSVIPNFSRAFDGESLAIAEKAARLLLTIFQEKITFCQNLQRSLDSEKVSTIKSLLNCIKLFVKSKHYEKLKNTQDNFPEQIYNSLNQLFQLFTMNDFVLDVFKKSCSITTYVVDFNNIGKWKFLISSLYISGCPQLSTVSHGMHGDTKNFYKPRFLHILDYISKKNNPKIVEKWWDIIATAIMPSLVRFKVLTETGQIEPEHVPYAGITPELRIAFLKFLGQQAVKEGIRLFIEETRNNALMVNEYVNTLICLISFFIEAPNTSEFIDGIQFLISLWSETSQTEKTNIVNLLRLQSPETLSSFLILYARVASFFVVKMYQSSRQSEEAAWESINALRTQWCLLLTVPVKGEIITEICKQFDTKYKLITIIIFLTFVYDMKYSMNTFLNLYHIKEKYFDGDMLIIIRKMVSIMAVALSPFFIGLDKEELEAYGLKTRQRNSRSKSSDDDQNAPVDPYEKIADIFNSPNTFEESLIINPQMKSEYNGLKVKTRIRILNLNSEGWTFEMAKNFISNILFGLRKDWQPSIFNSFISSLSAVRDFVPLSLQKQPTLIASTFFPDALKLGLDNYYNVEMLNAIACSAKQVGVISREGIDPSTCNLWIFIIIKYLCHSDSSIVNFTIQIALATVIQFAPHSYILIQFLMQIMKSNESISQQHKCSYILTSNSIFYKVSELHFPQLIEDNVSGFRMQLKNPSLFDTVFKNYRENAQTLIRVIILSLIADPLNSTVKKPYKHELFMHTFFCILIEDILSSDPVIHPMIPTILSAISIRSCLPEATSSNIREFTTIALCTEMFEPKIPDIGRIMIKKLMPLARFVHNEDDFVRIFKACAYAARKSNNCDSFTKKLKMLETKCKNKEFFNTAIQSLVYSIVPRCPPPSNDCDYRAVITTPNSSLIGVSKPMDDSFTLCVRTDASFTQFDAESIERKSAVQDYAMPLCETEEEEELDQFNFGSLMSSYTKVSKEEYETINNRIKDEVLNEGSGSAEVTMTCQEEKEEEKPQTEADSQSSPSSLAKVISLLPNSPSAISFLSAFLDIKNSIVHEMTKSIFRKVAPVFSLPTRECLKIGVIYVADHQVSQSEILSNTHQTASMQFHNFLRSIGEPVDIKTHRWYSGKLEGQTYNNFPYTIYYNDDQYEVMFHVSTLLPHSDDDTQRILKKKHIGNDNVHIVWCENKSGYDTTVITSQFNDAHIVIYPYTTEGLYHVLIKRKPNLNEAGPLPEESIVTAESLPLLVRESAIIHDRAARAQVEKQSYEQFHVLMEPLLC